MLLIMNVKETKFSNQIPQTAYVYRYRENIILPVNNMESDFTGLVKQNCRSDQARVLIAKKNWRSRLYSYGVGSGVVN